MCGANEGKRFELSKGNRCPSSMLSCNGVDTSRGCKYLNELKYLIIAIDINKNIIII